MITPEQTIELKKKILEQLKSHYDPERLEEISLYLDSLNNEQFEEFLIKNKMIKSSDDLNETNETTEQDEKQETNIFQLIIEGKVKSYKIAEDPGALAVLEINPKSLGHVIVIPKQNITKIEEIYPEAIEFTEQIAKHLKSKLKAKDALISKSSVLNHAIINIIPIYEEGTKLKGKPTEQELEALQKKLEYKEKVKKSKTKKSKPEPKIIYQLPKRRP